MKTHKRKKKKKEVNEKFWDANRTMTDARVGR